MNNGCRRRVKGLGRGEGVDKKTDFIGKVYCNYMALMGKSQAQRSPQRWQNKFFIQRNGQEIEIISYDFCGAQMPVMSGSASIMRRT